MSSSPKWAAAAHDNPVWELLVEFELCPVGAPGLGLPSLSPAAPAPLAFTAIPILWPVLRLHVGHKLRWYSNNSIAFEI